VTSDLQTTGIKKGSERKGERWREGGVERGRDHEREVERGRGRKE